MSEEKVIEVSCCVHCWVRGIFTGVKHYTNTETCGRCSCGEAIQAVAQIRSTQFCQENKAIRGCLLKNPKSTSDLFKRFGSLFGYIFLPHPPSRHTPLIDFKTRPTFIPAAFPAVAPMEVSSMTTQRMGATPSFSEANL